MQPVVIVELEIPAETLSALVQTGIVMNIDFFVFHRTPQSFRENVVKDASSAIHTDPNLMREQDRRKSRARKLAPLVTVENLWPTVP